MRNVRLWTTLLLLLTVVRPAAAEPAPARVSVSIPAVSAMTFQAVDGTVRLSVFSTGSEAFVVRNGAEVTPLRVRGGWATVADAASAPVLRVSKKEKTTAAVAYELWQF